MSSRKWYIGLLLETGEENSSSSSNNTQRDKQHTSNSSSGNSNERYCNVINYQKSFGSGQGSGEQEESGGTNVQGSSDGGKKERSRLNKEGGNTIDKQLLVISYEGENTKFLSSWEKSFDSGKVKSELFKLGEDSVFGSKSKKVEFTDTSYNVVLLIL